MNCMEPLGEQEDICSSCGAVADNAQSLPFIPKHVILAGRYIVGKGMEMDGEGLSYIGYDTVKKIKVYIREFFPLDFCTRQVDFKNVVVQPNFERYFSNLKSRFLKYYRSVARLRNLPDLVSVYDIFEENKTVYVIYEWIEGHRLDKFLGSKGGRLDWEDAKIMFEPLLNSLSRMEAAGVKHLGISPSNILVTEDNKLRLIGFAIKELRSANSVISSQLYDGCTALEQYLDDYESSESTDVYGFAATLFFAVTGEYPPSALERKKSDKLMMSQDILNSLPENVVSAIATALRVYPNNRTLSFENLRIELLNSPLLKVQDIEETEEDFSYDSRGSDTVGKKNNSMMWGVISCIIALVLLLSCLGIYWFWLRDNSNNSSANTSQSQSENTPEEKSENEKEETDVKEKISVPDLTGKNLKSLQEELKYNSKYNLVLLSEEFSDSVGEGCIISQNPGAGGEMYAGSTIAVNVSKGNKTRVLPSVEGRTLSEASQLLVNNKLKPVAVSEFSKDYAEGIVIGYKNNKVGDKLDYDSQVTIVVSKGAV